MARPSRKAERRAFDHFNDRGLAILQHHDPIGLDALGAPDDEYDCVLSGVLMELSNDREVSLGTWMAGHFVEHFGVTPDIEAVRSAASALILLWHTDELSVIRR